MKNNPKLSIVILNYNTKELLRNCLDSLIKVKDEADFEIIVSDNGSTDGSLEMLTKYSEVKVVKNSENLGYAKGNNMAKDVAKGMFILFLNSDTIVNKGAIKGTLNFLENTPKAGAVSCKIVLPNGNLDRDVRRRFPTPWVSFVHFFTGIDRIFPKSKLFPMYWYGDYPEDETMEIDVLQGAYFLARKKVLDEVGWFDEDYFLDGEDIDLCWKIKEAGWKIFYYPKVSIEHIKGATKGKIKSFGKVTKDERLRFVNAGVDSMAIFYKKRLWTKYPLAFNLFVLTGISLLKGLRWVKALLS